MCDDITWQVSNPHPSREALGGRRLVCLLQDRIGHHIMEKSVQMTNDTRMTTRLWSAGVMAFKRRVITKVAPSTSHGQGSRFITDLEKMHVVEANDLDVFFNYDRRCMSLSSSVTCSLTSVKRTSKFPQRVEKEIKKKKTSNGQTQLGWSLAAFSTWKLRSCMPGVQRCEKYVAIGNAEQ